MSTQNIHGRSRASARLRRDRRIYGAALILLLLRAPAIDVAAEPVSPPEPVASVQARDAAMIVHWRFDEGTGTTATDSVGAYPAELLQGASWSDGRHGGAVRLEASSAYVQLPYLDVHDAGLTLAAWVNITSYPASTEQRIIAKATGTAEQAHFWALSQIRIGGKNFLRFRLKAGGTTATLDARTGELPTKTWFHAAATYDGATMRLYLNGKEVGRMVKSGPVDTNIKVPANLGRSPDGSNYFRGAIDEVRIYGRSLDATEIADVMNDAGAPPPDGQRPTVPTGLEALAVSPTQIHLQWTNSTDDTGVAGYRVRRNAIQVATTSMPGHVDAALTPSTSYTYTVSAFDAAGNESAQSVARTATTPSADSAPPTITGVAVADITDTGAVISWATDELATSSVEYGATSSYGSAVHQHVLTRSHAVRVGPLQASTAYQYRAVSTDAAGNVGRSVNLTFTTVATPGAEPNGPMAQWLLDEGSGTVAADCIGGRAASLNAGAAWTQGRSGKGISLDGTGGYLAVPAMDIDSAGLTLSAWVKHSGFPTGADQRIITKSSTISESDHYWMLSQVTVEGANRLRFRLKTGSVTTTLVASSGDLPLNEWYHAAATYDGAVMRIFLNGREVGSTPKSGIITRNINVPVNIGRNPDGYHHLHGALDDVRIYTRALSTTELAALILEAGDPPADSVPPSRPAGLQASAASATEIHLQWTASTDDVGVAGYRVRRQGVVIGSSQATSYADANLRPSTSYGYTVSAFDAAGNESQESLPVAEITKADSVNKLPLISLTSPLSGSSYVGPATVLLAASASDPENRLKDVQFWAGNVLLATVTAAPYSFSWTGVPAGSYSLTAMARDADGGFASSAPITISVAHAVPAPWRVAFTASTDHETRVTGYLLEIFRSGLDPNGATPVVASDLGKPAPDALRQIIVDRTVLFGGLAPGTYTLTVRSVGIDGTARSAPLTFTR